MWSICGASGIIFCYLTSQPPAYEQRASGLSSFHQNLLPETFFIFHHLLALDFYCTSSLFRLVLFFFFFLYSTRIMMQSCVRPLCIEASDFREERIWQEGIEVRIGAVHGAKKKKRR